MICVSLRESDPERCLQILKNVDFAEIRLDKSNLCLIDVQKIFSQKSKLIATYRTDSQKNFRGMDLLLGAIEAGATYVDIDVGANEDVKNALIKKARRHGCQVIVSYHNLERTPPEEELRKIIDRCFDQGADIAKIACLAQSAKDNVTILGLLSDERPLVVIGMGQIGKITRIVGPILGSQFTYASLDEGKETAEGQMSYSRLSEIMERLKDS